MNKKIVFCTLRDNKGATGGPAGVLYLQKSVLGDSISGCRCEYWFNTFKGNSKIAKAMNIVSFFLNILLTRNAYYFTHDIMSARILALLGKKYTLVYHSQGPILEEAKNLGTHISKYSEKVLASRERIAFTHANTLHFPSMGAAEMYFESKYATCRRDEVNLKKPLYNIIPLVKAQKPTNFDLEKEDDILTFFSLGTLTIAKGQDLTVEFLASFLKKYTKPVRYIIVGKGPLKDQLLKQLEKIKCEFSHFNYYYYDAVPHDTVMYIHQIADIYIMLHRISIFDFATLEAMSQNSAIILSKVGGNPEFDRDNNIIFAEDVRADMISFAKTEFEKLKHKNKEVFDKFFSKEAFIKQYEIFVNDII